MTFITPQELKDLSDHDYFSQMSYDTVIFELKANLQESDTLNDIFNAIKSEDCKLLFVSAYEISEYSNDSFVSYADNFLKVKKDRAFAYVSEAVQGIVSNYSSSFGGVLLLDHRLLSIPAGNPMVSDICATSPFLKLLIYQLCLQMNLVCNLEDCNDMMNAISENGLDIYVNKELTNYYYRVDDINGSPIVVTTSSCNLQYLFGKPLGFFAAFGIWELMPNVYSVWKKVQDNAETYIGHSDLTVYIYEEEPIPYSEDGLEVVTDTDLRQQYDNEPVNPPQIDEKELLIAALLAIL